MAKDERNQSHLFHNWFGLVLIMFKTKLKLELITNLKIFYFLLIILSPSPPANHHIKSHQTFFFPISNVSSPILFPHYLSFFFTSFFYFLQKTVLSPQLPSPHHFFAFLQISCNSSFASSLFSLYCISSLIIFFFFSFPHRNSLLFLLLLFSFSFTLDI